VTVISTVITRYCTVHASDSLITKLQPDGSAIPIEWEQSKIILVRPWRGAMSYWGWRSLKPTGGLRLTGCRNKPKLLLAVLRPRNLPKT
jgi:hypothetical protein